MYGRCRSRIWMTRSSLLQQDEREAHLHRQGPPLWRHQRQLEAQWESLEAKVNETKVTIKFQLKKVLCMGVAVGNLSMEEKQIQQNIQNDFASSRLVSHQESLEAKVNETKATIKFQLKKVLCMGVAVGNLLMEEK